MSGTGFTPSNWAAIAAAVSTGLAAVAAFGSWFTAQRIYKFSKYSILKKRELIILAQLIERHSLYESVKKNPESMNDNEFIEFFEEMTFDDNSTINLINELKILDQTISINLSGFEWSRIGEDTVNKIKALKDAQKNIL
ncbi:hypothetical protein [Celerinatantimonas diazotrophica]|uniref:Uncharacterized protein n=1 Tax=Celerinatantimonas diazotrophica TaxID=412034 RepID=A0A4V2PNM4_9GAMM|nr:hypothetical protein [Celerinatantimonas diazotrophica]TCK47561.1 hypothetical protein EV690_2596 [Celerinatantimonas diazotrophica]CAG9296818.1 hypothetical protein CEDIAZO_01976 [Celerinatantimonas diazotrophica]